MYPDWLPDELRLNRSLQEDIDELYAIYKRDFIDGSICVVDDAPVYVNSIPDRSIWEGKYPHGFTHIVTRGAKERTIDYDRAKKLPWVRAILENYTAPEVTAFWSETPKGATLYLWLADLDFVVVIRPKDERNIVIGQKRMIITAYYIDEPYTKRDLQKKYGNSTCQL